MAKRIKMKPDKAKTKARKSSRTKSAFKVKIKAKAELKAPNKKPLPEDKTELIKMLEKAWPGENKKNVSAIFNKIKETLKKEVTHKPAAQETKQVLRKTNVKPPPISFALLDLFRRTFSAHDLLFLRKQITYHIAASAELVNVFADLDRIQLATSNLIEYMANHAPRGSRINVQLKEIQMRSGTGVEAIFSGTDNSLHSIDKASFLQRMYQSETEDGAILVNCRELVSSQGGQMWADLPKPKNQIFHVVLPSHAGFTKNDSKANQMFKYDISISNYANIRKRFGIKKSLSLVGQIEMYVRALVRHPIDIVTAVREKGTVTTIYESPKGSAQSVASRISQRLGTEEFRIGKKPVDLAFRYELSQLPSSIKEKNIADKGSVNP